MNYRAITWSVSGGGCILQRALSISLALSLVLAGCSNQPYDEPEDVNPVYTTIAVVSREDVIEMSTSNTASEQGTKGAWVGGAAGAVGGALIGAAFCGPYLYAVCAVVYGSYGLATGGAVGVIAGNEAWSTTGIPDREAHYLSEDFAHQDEQRDFNSELVDHIRVTLPEDMLRSPEEADVQVIPVIEQVEIVRLEKGVIRMEMQASLTYAFGTPENPGRHGTIEFKARSEAGDLDEWTTTGSSLMSEAIATCQTKLAAKMARLILEKRSGQGA